MLDGSSIVRQRQLAIRRAMDRRSLSLKIVSMDSGVPYSSLASYFPADPHAEPAQMPVGVLYSLIGYVPDELLSLLLPEGRKIVRVPENVDHDAIGAWAEAYAAKKLAAHRADSECQERIGPNERADLDATVVQFPGVAV